MERKFGSEFIADLDRKGEICSYCAVDSQYIRWLENHLEVARCSASPNTEIPKLLDHIKYLACQVGNCSHLRCQILSELIMAVVAQLR